MRSTDVAMMRSLLHSCDVLLLVLSGRGRVVAPTGPGVLLAPDRPRYRCQQRSLGAPPPAEPSAAAAARTGGADPAACWRPLPPPAAPAPSQPRRLSGPAAPRPRRAPWPPTQPPPGRQAAYSPAT